MAIMSHVHEIQTVYNIVQNPQMVLLSEKGAPMINTDSRCCIQNFTFLDQQDLESELINQSTVFWPSDPLNSRLTCHGKCSYKVL